MIEFLFFGEKKKKALKKAYMSIWSTGEAVLRDLELKSGLI